jgi:hemoglobin
MEGAKPSPAQRSLYDRIGGAKVIVQVVDDFVGNVAGDAKITDEHRKRFREGDVAGLKQKLVDQIGQAAGGPQKYTGKGLKEAHQELGFTDKEFDALVADLSAALDKNKVGRADQEQLLSMLGVVRGDE